LIHQIPADHFFVCSEETTLVIGNEKDETELFGQFPRLESISRKVVEKIFAEHLQSNVAYFTDKPEQRYLKLLATKPHLFQRVPQYQLASYIGVTPESFSRIRKRIFKKMGAH
jgi:CRP-like cAMP-binding protein